MAKDDPAIEVDGLRFTIPPSGIQSVLRGDGIAVRLLGLNIQITEETLNALLTRLKPETQTEPTRATLTSRGAVIDHYDGERPVQLDLALSDLQVQVRDGKVTITGG